MTWISSMPEATNELRERAGSRRQLTLSARSKSGANAHPDVVPVMGLRSGDTAALVRLRLALERQSAAWLARPRAGQI